MAISVANPTSVVKRPIISYWNGTKWKDFVSFRGTTETKLTATLNEALDTSETDITVSSSAEFYTGQLIKFGSTSDDSVANTEELEVVSITDTTTIVVATRASAQAANSGASIYVAVSDVIKWELVDVLHSPMMMRTTLNNSSKDPFSNSGSSSKGPHSGKLGSFSPIKVRDGDTHHIYFYGIAYESKDSFKIGWGQVLEITAHDFVQELKDNTGNGNNYLLDNDANLYDAVVPHGTGADNLNIKQELWQTTADPPQGYIKSRSGLIKSLVAEYSQNLTTPGDANSGDTIRFTESVAALTDANKPNEPYNLGSMSSILSHIQSLAVGEPHTVGTTTEITHGYDYYVDANWGDATDTTASTLSTHKPTAFFNYFKRGTRPSASPATYGLSIHYPSPDSTSDGDFSKTTMKVPMTYYDVSRPKNEVFTDASVKYIEQTTHVSKNDEGEIITETLKHPESGIFELIAIKTAANFDDFVDLLEASDKKLETGTPGTGSAEFLKAKIAEVNDSTAADGTGISAGDTNITVDSSDASGFYIGQSIEIDSEVMKVTAVNTGANTVTVTRGANHPTTGASTSAAEHDNDADIYALEVCRLQWTSLQGGTATVGSGATAYVLISEVDERISENSTYWAEGTTFKGQTSSSASFQIRSRPRTAYEVRRSLYMSEGIENPNVIRKKVFSRLERKTEDIVRAKIQTYERPFFYFDDSPASIDATSGSSQTINLSGSVNPQSYGITAGMLVVKLDANNAATNIYGYITSTTSALVKVTWAYGTVSASDTLRYYVPVRAGDYIHVRNDLVNLDQTMLVTKLDHKDEGGVLVTRLDTVGAVTQKEGGGAKRRASVDTAEMFLEEEQAAGQRQRDAMALSKQTITIDSTFSASNESTVAWTAGTIYIGTKEYPIAAGNTGTMATQAGPYTLYYEIGNSTFQIKTLSAYETVSKYSPFHVRLGTTEYDIPSASWRLANNVQGANATKIKAESLLKGQSLPASLLQKGNQQSSSNLSFEPTGTSGEYNKIKFGQKGSVGSDATISYADNTTETVVHSATATASLGNSSSVSGGKVTLAAGANYIYKEVGKPELTTMRVANDSTSEQTFEVTSTSNMYVGQMLQISEENLTVASITDGDTVELNRGQNSTSAQTQALNNAAGNPVKIYAVNTENKILKISATYSDVYQDDRMLLATVIVPSSDDGSDSPSIFPFTGNESTISSESIAGGGVKAGNIQANSITAAKLEANLVLASNIKTSATVNDGSGTDQAGLLINNSGIYGYDAGGTAQVSISATTGRVVGGGGSVDISSEGVRITDDTDDITETSYLTFGGSNKSTASGTTLAEALDTSEDGVDVADGSVFRVGHAILIDSEQMLILSIASNTLTVTREYASTSAATHTSSTAISIMGQVTSYMTVWDAGSGATPSMYFLTTTQEAGSGSGFNTSNAHNLIIGAGAANKTMFVLPSYTVDLGNDGVVLGSSTHEYWAVYSALLLGQAGSAASPSFSFNGDLDTGMYRSGANYLAFATGGALRGRFYSGGLILDTMGITSGTDVIVDGSNVVQKKSSSKRYKRNIVDIALDSNKVYDLRPVDFEWNEKSATDGKKDIGLIAEEVAEILPQIVNYNNDKTPESVSYDKLSVILLMEIKKLKEEIEKLKENK